MRWDRCCKREIRARIKRRINVDQIHLAGELGQERGQDVLLIAPDEAVAPLRIMAGRRQLQGALPLLHALIDGLNGLKRQLNADRSPLVPMLVVFAVPDKFSHALYKKRGRGTSYTSRLCAGPSVLN